MSIPVTCPHCGKSVKAPDSAAGHKAKCPGCQGIIEIPAASGGAAAPHAVAEAQGGGALGALAQAVEAPGPVPVQAVKPQPVRPAPAPAAPPAAAEPAPAAPPAGDDVIAGPPIGVQTPSGLSVRRKAAAKGLRWQRTLAAGARIVGLTLAGLCLALGIATMILLAMRGSQWLLLGLGAFVLMFIQATMSAVGGLLVRHILLLLADLDQESHRQQDLLDGISERLE